MTLVECTSNLFKKLVGTDPVFDKLFMHFKSLHPLGECQLYPITLMRYYFMQARNNVHMIQRYNPLIY